MCARLCILFPFPQALSGDKASPSARHLILSQHPPLDPGAIKGSGKGGRITKGDVLVALGAVPPPPVQAAHAAGSRVNLAAAASPAAAAAAPAAAPVLAAAVAPSAAVPAAVSPSVTSGGGGGGGGGGGPAGRPVKDVKPTMVRKVIASRLTESKATVPHFYVSMDCRIDALLTLRKTLKVRDVEGREEMGFATGCAGVCLCRRARQYRTSLPRWHCLLWSSPGLQLAPLLSMVWGESGVPVCALSREPGAWSMEH